MSNQVKYYTTSQTGLTSGYDGNTASSLIGLLQSIFVNGFNSKTVTTLSLTGTTANIYVSTGHGFENGQVVLVSGATPSAYNGEWVCSYVDANNITFQIAGSPATPATGTITVKAAPLGWTQVYASGSSVVFQSANTAGSQMFYQFTEAATVTATRSSTNAVVSLAGMKLVEVSSWDYMTGVGVGSYNSKMFIHKAPASLTWTALQLVVVGDDTSAWILPQGTSAIPYFVLHGLGDYISWGTNNWNGFLMGKFGVDTTSQDPGTAGTGGYFLGRLGENFSIVNPQLQLAREQTGAGIFPLPGTLNGMVDANRFFGSGPLSYPNVISNKRRAFPVVIYQSTIANDATKDCFRGVAPGLYNTGSAGIFNNTVGYEKQSGFLIAGTTRTLLLVRGYALVNASYQCAYGIDITGPWR